MYTEGFNTDIETLGERDSYHDIGPAWASAAVGPLAWYKFFAGEGGLRVPLIISGASNGQNIAATTGGVSPVLGWATDIAPTILELAGIETLDSLPGKTLVPLISGETTELRAVKEGIGYELGGNKAFFRGGYKLVYNRYGSNNRWQLFNLAADPAEKTDLSAAEPQRFNAMLKAYNAWAEAQGVLPVADDYHQGRTVMLKGILNRPGLLATVALLLLLPVLILIALVVWLFRRRKVN
jgi:arylsulfatase/uncharacterized sulfatase